MLSHLASTLLIVKLCVAVISHQDNEYNVSRLQKHANVTCSESLIMNVTGAEYVWTTDAAGNALAMEAFYQQ